MDLENRTSETSTAYSGHLFCTQELIVRDQGCGAQQYSSDMTSQSKNVTRSPEDAGVGMTEDGLSNGACDFDSVAAPDGAGDSGAAAEDEHRALGNDGASDLSGSDLSLPEVCVSTHIKCSEEEMNYEVQQAYRIFSSFLVDKYKSLTGLFLRPVGHQVAQRGVGGVLGRGQAQLKQSMCLQRMEEKFDRREYESITEFVADFRLMLENCYRYHGVDHWISKQAQKLEILLEQKLTLLSRMLREKTSLAVTSKGRFGSEEERGSGGTSTRRRLAPRSLATLSVGGHESVMVQTLRLEEQQRAKDEKRQRELERREAEEMSAKEVEDWEQSLLSQALAHPVETLWELPAIGHFLCLAQTALNLPEIIFFELERCLLMPRCSSLLSKLMTSLLSPPQRRATLHRRPSLPYRRWESELRQRVAGWYRAVGASRNQVGRAEQLGLCHRFFSILGEASPLEEKPFHSLPFYQRVWLLKGLCDHVYQTQKDVQDALLSQPIHECRESILGYDGRENAYIHFPHFCGADLRIYCQSPSTPPAFPPPSITVKALEKNPDVDADLSEGVKEEEDQSDGGRSAGAAGSGEFGSGRAEALGLDGDEEKSTFKKEGSESGSCDGDSCDGYKLNWERSNSFPQNAPSRYVEKSPKAPPSRQERRSPAAARAIEAAAREPCLSVGEYSYTGRSPARLVSRVSPTKLEEVTMVGDEQSTPNPPFSECPRSGKSRRILELLAPERGQTPKDERLSNKIWTKRKKRKKRGPTRVKVARGEPVGRRDEAAKAAARRVSPTIKRKEKKKKPRTGKNLESRRTIKAAPPAEPSFKLVCTNLEELRGLISQIEDELDDLESTKKRLGRWYYRREAVKELHSTLIRLLNELSPWEPKLLKAFQRNRLRLKKEFDDYKKHPEFNNFVREEGVSSSSSSSEEEQDEERGLGARACSLSDHYRRSEEEDLEVPRGLWKGASTRETLAEAEAPANHLSPPDAKEKGTILLPSSVMTSSGPQFKSNSDSTWTSGPGPQASPVLHSNAGLPKGYTPIPTLLAKSVGNKVTLMKRPADYSEVRNKDRQRRGSLPPSAVMTAKAQISSSVQQTQAHNQPAAPSPPVKATPRQAITKNPPAVNCAAPEGPGQLREAGGSSPVAVPVRPFVDQTAGENIAQQVVMLPSKFLPQKDAQVPASGPLCMSTNVPGFTIPEHKIPVQQVAPLKNATISRTPVGLRSQEEVTNAAGFTGTHVWNPPFRLTKSSVSSSSSSTNSSGSGSSELCKAPEDKQELRTVCIRDSQSILVTTRGGNTGIVKVQSSDQNPLGSFSMNPVITISPQLKAFLVSKAAQNLGPSAPAQTSCTIPAVTSPSGAQTPRPVSTTAKSHDTLTMAGLPTGPGSIPAPDPRGTAANAPDAFAKTPVSPVTLNPCTQAAGRSLQAELANKSGGKRASTEETSQHTKFILVSPPSLSTVSNVGLSNSPPSSTRSLPAPGVMFLSQAAAGFTSTCAAIPPAQPQSTSANLKLGFRAGQPVGNLKPEASKLKNIPRPSGQFQLSGRTTMIGQTIGALSLSPSKSTPVSAPGADRPAAFTTALNSSTTTSSSPQPVPRPSLPTGCQQQAVPSFTMICHPGTSAASSAPTGGDLGVAHTTCPAQVATTVQSTPALTSPPVLTSQPSHTSGLFKESSLFSQLAPSKPQIPASPSPAAAANTQFSTSSAGTIQQRIVINTSAPLAGGTQILLNNARFVVPPQGLGPGSHVLIISSPAPQQVPPASTSSTGLAVPLQRATHDSTASLAPLSPRSPVRLSTAPAATYPFVASSLRANAADGEPVQLPCMGSAVLPGKPNGNFAPPPVGSPTLVPFPPRLGAPGLMSSVSNRVPVASPAPVNKTLPAGTRAQAECSPAVAHALSRMSAPVSSLPVVASPLIPASSVIARTPALVASVTAPGPLLQPQQGAAASSIPPLPPGPLHIRLDNASARHLGPALMQTVPPAMAIPSSRMQTPPVATVPPIGSLVHTFESTPMVAAPSSNSTVLVTSARPISSLTFNNPVPTAQALGKLPLAAASKGTHANVASRLLISPDGAVLNTLQCQASAAELAACSGTKDSRVVFHNSSTGELRTHDSEFQPSQAGRS
ncbi:uncharacterized protein KIAA2026 isoform X2 [Takifugu rubripes]|uniref:Bromo domain-containing protein n=1 Tax=Takifugu rubripes TaxID=31033 RepID=A0A3B5K3Z8_TAKRU|nr:uncharacterized protein KIAA2026 homolog isoform X2 [Takifugu rubripes]